MTEAEYLALPPAQRKEFQKELKAKGLYHGPLDAKSGDGMRTGLKAMDREKTEAEARDREGKLEQQRIENERLRLETEKGKATTENAGAEAKLARDKLYQDQASSTPGLATQFGAWVGAPAATAGLGYYAGGKLNDRLNRAQEKRNVTLRGAAEDRVRGLTTRDGAVKGVTLAGAMPYANSTMRATSRMAPHLGLGGLAVGKGSELILGDHGEDQPFYSRMGDVGAGMGYIGFGSGLLKRGIEQAASPGVSPDAQALSVINSSQLRRGGKGSKLAEAMAGSEATPTANAAEASTAAAKAPTPGSADHMRAQLKDLGVKGTSRMLKGELATRLAEVMQEHGAKRTVGKKLPKVTGKAAIPLAVGSYMAATGDSEAADATTGERVGNAAQNFGVGAGAAYGGSKLADALSKIAPMAMKAGGMGLSLLNPAMMTDMTDGLAEIPPEAIQAHDNAIFNRNARWLPEWMMTQSDMNAKEMAQVPTPSPERQAMGPRVTDTPPEGPFAPGINARLARMSNGGATPEQIAMFLNQTVGQ